MSAASSPHSWHLRPILRAVGRRLGQGILILLAIAFLTLIGLILAERGRAGLPAQLLDAALEAFRRTLDYLVNHPATYVWHRERVNALPLVLSLFGRSTGLLVLSLTIAAGVGFPLGVWIAVRGHRRLASLAMPLSVLGISTPSFLLAMLLWIANIQLGRWLGGDTAPLPSVGFGWDKHVVMPALVLAMRPLAQLIQITRVSLGDVLNADYIRTAAAKGLSRHEIISSHALRNVLIPVLTTLGISLRFSLATLPVVELFFAWPGLGHALLQAIEQQIPTLVVDLVVALGLLFLVINGLLDLVYQVIDPRVRDEALAQPWKAGGLTWRQRWQELARALNGARAWLAGIGSRGRTGKTGDRRPSVSVLPRLSAALDDAEAPGIRERAGRHRAIRAGLTNPILVLGTLMVLALLATVIWGEGWTPASAYTTHGLMKINGELAAPPFKPSTAFPWGSDVVGRDIQALVLAGAKTTLTLALLATLARLLAGTVLGLLAGWWRGGWLDRLIQGVAAVWAAFPVTLFAMILILALGIQQGIGVFVLALCVVGWGEIAQFVRGQVISLKPQPYIEGARAIGARSGWVLVRHILPHLWTPLLVMAALEMASVLMLLADLGFLNIFLGGGFKAEIGQTGQMQPIIYNFSDVPEWGALLANIRNWWRSYPWQAWYPGVAFFLAILSFNLVGEGLRRFIDESRVNIGRLINRYTVIAVVLAVVAAGWLVRSTTSLAVYGRQAEHFNVQRALDDIGTLASPELQGRESGTPGAQAAADHIAAQMAEIGLFPAGDRESYVHTMVAPRGHLVAEPTLEILDPSARRAVDSFAYRQDFVEYTGYGLFGLEKQGDVVGLAIATEPDEASKGYTRSLLDLPLNGQVLLMHEADFDRLRRMPTSSSGSIDRLTRRMAGFLIVADDPDFLERRYLYPGVGFSSLGALPAMMITPQVAERLLAGTNIAPAGLAALSSSLEAGQTALTPPGARIAMAIPLAPEDMQAAYHHVIGFIPGHDALGGLDSHVIIVSAYYDGLGIGPDGVLYPGANDNASGVAAMLEIARAMKETVQPRKTVVFVAWSGGERREGFSVTNAMAAKIGFNLLTVDAVIELSGMAAGSGKGLALGPGTSFSLVQLFQAAGAELGTAVTTRGRGPHFGLETAAGFGERSALSAYVSWDGADQVAHTRRDSIEAIDPQKLRRSGQTTLLAVSVLSQSRR
ncbi:MAG: ABC transporter permease subunit [Chloroflexi bacterium]|nr:ABC transporter permease subunit [Chloroflexota bacterium]